MSARPGMTGNTYQKAAARTIPAGLTRGERITNAALGLAGENGEVIEHIKKHLFHGKDLDRDAVAKELGDVLWYVAMVATTIGVELDDIMTGNIEKLEARHPDGFSP